MTGPELEPHRRYLAAVLYRLTGDAAETDDLVQETFARALARPEVAADPANPANPANPDRPLRPWLLRVATNLGIDALRARKARAYPGPWLPTPVETGDQAAPGTSEVTAEVTSDMTSDMTSEMTDPGARYERVESATLAFLVALEVLSPQERAVLLLRDVFGLSVDETAGAIDTSGNAVKVAHHHARAALAGYDAARLRPTRAAQARARDLLERFLGAIIAGDVAAARALLREDVVATGDGGGRYLAGLVPVVGSDRVVRLYSKLTARRGVVPEIGFTFANGLPALLVRVEAPPGRFPPRSLIQLVPSARDGRIALVYSVSVPEKLRAIPFLK